MSKVEKKPNYSTEQIKQLIMAINIVDCSFIMQKSIVQDLSDNNPLFANKTSAQLMAKLCHLSKSGVTKPIDNSPVYTSKIYTTKNSGSVISKSDLVEAIAEKMACNSELLTSLDKCNKGVLLMLLGSLPTKAD